MAYWSSAVTDRLRSFSRPALSGLLLLCLGLASCSNSTQASNAGSSADTDLEAKVLDIIRKNPDVVINAVQTYQKDQEESRRKAQRDFLDKLLTQPKAVIGDSPTQGSPSDSIVLIKFSDFQCPYCAEAHKAIKAFMAKHGDQVTFTYKHLPLTAIHPEALPAAKATWAAMQQNKFWEFEDALFTNQDKLGDAFYEETAKSLGLELDKFNRDRASKAAEESIQKDVDLAKSLGINGTPFLIMNGQVIEGGPDLPAQLEDTLAKVSKPK